MLSSLEMEELYMAVMRGPLVLLIFGMLSGAAMHLLHLLRIDYGPTISVGQQLKKIDKPQERGKLVMTVSGGLLFVLLACLVASEVASTTPNVAVGGYMLILGLLMLCPLPSTLRECFGMIITTLGRVLSPSDVKFEEVLLADALTSLSRIFSDAGTTTLLLACSWLGHSSYPRGLKLFISSGMACFPYALRVRQCLSLLRAEGDPRRRQMHTLNIGKYMSSFPLIWLGALRALASPALKDFPLLGAEVVAAIVNTVYSLVWDVKMDWGLGQHGSKHIGLRNIMLISHRWPYYAAIGIDCVLRCTWIVQMTLGRRLAVVYAMDIMLVFELLEVFRRCMWGVLRLEWETIQQSDEEDIESQKLLANGVGPHLI